MPGDEVDGSARCARREELEREPAVSRLRPPAHLVPQPVQAVRVQHRRGAAGALPGALPAAVAGPAGVALARLPAAAPSLNLVHHYWLIMADYWLVILRRSQDSSQTLRDRTCYHTYTKPCSKCDHLYLTTLNTL